MPDKEEVRDLILKEARRDCFQGVGRIFVKSFLKEYRISEEELMEALKLIPHKIKYYLDEPKILLVQL